MDEFLQAFGDLKVSVVAIVIVATIFLFQAYKRWKDYIVKRHDIEAKNREDLATALEGIKRYPEYREQSHQIQLTLQQDINTIASKYESIENEVLSVKKQLADLIEEMRQKDLATLKDKLIELYKYYTNIEVNPSQSWNTMEKDAFWDLFDQYEKRGGDGFMHEVVQPEMLKLKIVEMARPKV